MTWTCNRCNNDFGSRVEVDLLDWYEGALTTWFTSETVRGKRKTGRLLVRWTENGEYVLLPAGKSDEIYAEILAAGNVEMDYDTPEHKRWSIALLKCIYLALCIKFGVIEGEWADQVRADLLAARDAPSRADVPASEIARRLHVLRGFGPEPMTPHPVVTSIMHDQTARWRASSSPDGCSSPGHRSKTSRRLHRPRPAGASRPWGSGSRCRAS